ncbi:MAG: hypothetical protein L0Z53_15105 [Acidobacteriales bacterium]|nr:hypothetical protein [Terriglobales bacterium]
MAKQKPETAKKPSRGPSAKPKKPPTTPAPARIPEDINEILLYLVETGEGRSRNAVINKLIAEALAARFDMGTLKADARAYFASKNQLISEYSPANSQPVERSAS